MNKLDPRFCYSTAGFGGSDLQTALDLIAETGFSNVEICGAHGHLPLDADIPNIRGYLKSRQLQCPLIHAPARERVLGAPDNSWRTEAASVLARYIHIAADIGASGAIMHPVPNPTFVSDEDTPQLHQKILTALRRSLDELTPLAEETGVRILLENLPYSCKYPMLSLAQLTEIIEPYPSEALGLIIDVGHAQLSGHSPAGEIRAAGSRLGGTHLQDNDALDDRHWVPGEGVINWDDIRVALRDIAYGGLWTFEVINSTDNQADDSLLAKTRAVAQRWLNSSPRQ